MLNEEFSIDQNERFFSNIASSTYNALLLKPILACLSAFFPFFRLKDNNSLLSTEIIQLFCIVPCFYDFLPESEGLISILNLSLGDSRLYQAVINLLQDLRKQNVRIYLFIISILKIFNNRSRNFYSFMIIYAINKLKNFFGKKCKLYIFIFVFGDF